MNRRNDLIHQGDIPVENHLPVVYTLDVRSLGRGFVFQLDGIKAEIEIEIALDSDLTANKSHFFADHIGIMSMAAGRAACCYPSGVMPAYVRVLVDKQDSRLVTLNLFEMTNNAQEAKEPDTPKEPRTFEIIDSQMEVAFDLAKFDQVKLEGSEFKIGPEMAEVFGSILECGQVSIKGCKIISGNSPTETAEPTDTDVTPEDTEAPGLELWSYNMTALCTKPDPQNGDMANLQYGPDGSKNAKFQYHAICSTPHDGHHVLRPNHIEPTEKGRWLHRVRIEDYDLDRLKEAEAVEEMDIFAKIPWTGDASSRLRSVHGMAPYDQCRVWVNVNDEDGAYIKDVETVFTYDPHSTADDDGANVLRPDNIMPFVPGRWLSDEKFDAPMMDDAYDGGDVAQTIPEDEIQTTHTFTFYLPADTHIWLPGISEGVEAVGLPPTKSVSQWCSPERVEVVFHRYLTDTEAGVLHEVYNSVLRPLGLDVKAEISRSQRLGAPGHTKGKRLLKAIRMGVVTLIVVSLLSLLTMKGYDAFTPITAILPTPNGKLTTPADLPEHQKEVRLLQNK